MPSRIPKARTTVLLLAAGLMLAALQAGCWFEKKPPEDAIAIVGKNYLRPADVTRTLDEMGLDNSDPNLRAQVVNRWVDRQILMHEAERLGLDKDKDIARKLQELKTDLVINRLYEEEIQVEPPSDEAVIAYWQNHTGEFTRVTDEVRLIIGYAPNRNQAWGVRNGLDRSATGDELVGLYPEVRFDTTESMSVERLPKQVARAIEPLRSGQASLPFEIEGQWLVAKLVERSNNGRPRPLDEMMPSLRARMTAEQRAREQVSYIAALRREARRQGLVQVRVPSDLTMNIDEQDAGVDSVDSAGTTP